MRWFKHYSDNHRGKAVNTLLDEKGYFGVFLYYTIYEICNEKLEKVEGRALQESDMEFKVHRRVICSASRAKPSSVESGLSLGQSCGLWTFVKDGEFFIIKIPILLELLEHDQKKSRQKVANKASKKRLDKEEDKEEEVEAEEESTTSTPSTPLVTDSSERLVKSKQVWQTVQMNLGYPREMFDEIEKDAWLIFQTNTDPKKEWARFLSHYIKNEKEKIRQNLLKKHESEISPEAMDLIKEFGVDNV